MGVDQNVQGCQQCRQKGQLAVTPELKAHILRYYHVEQWRTGTIARQLKVHHGTVERALRQAGLPRIGCVRASNIDAYFNFILR